MLEERATRRKHVNYFSSHLNLPEASLQFAVKAYFETSLQIIYILKTPVSQTFSNLYVKMHQAQDFSNIDETLYSAINSPAGSVHCLDCD